jgi:hypothetical protein
VEIYSYFYYQSEIFSRLQLELAEAVAGEGADLAHGRIKGRGQEEVTAPAAGKRLSGNKEKECPS